MKATKIIIFEEDEIRTLEECTDIFNDLIDCIEENNFALSEVITTQTRNPALDDLLKAITNYAVCKDEIV